MNDPTTPHRAPAGAEQLAAERERVETSPAMPPEAEQVDPAGDEASVAHVKHEHGSRMNH